MSRGRNGAAGGAKGARRATVAAPAAVRGGKGRWSAGRKMTVVLELLRGAELEETSPFNRYRNWFGPWKNFALSTTSTG